MTDQQNSKDRHSSNEEGKDYPTIDLSDDEEYLTPPHQTPMSSRAISHISKPQPKKDVLHPDQLIHYTAPRALPLIICRSSDRSHHKNVAQTTTTPETMLAGAQSQNSTVINTTGSQKVVVSSVSETVVPSIIATNSSSMLESNSFVYRRDTPPIQIVLDSQQDKFGNRVETLAANASRRGGVVFKSAKKSCSSHTGLEEREGSGNDDDVHSQQPSFNNEAGGRLQQGGARVASDGGVTDVCNTSAAAVISTTATSQSSTIITTKAPVAATAATTTAAISAAGLTPTIPRESSDISHVIMTPKAASLSTQSRGEQEMSSTPLPQAPASLLHQSDTGRIIEPQPLPYLVTIPPVHSVDSSVDNVQSKTTNSIVGGIRMKSRPKRKGPIMYSPPSTPTTKNHDDCGTEPKINTPQYRSKSDNENPAEENTSTTAGADSKNFPSFSWDLYLKLEPAEIAPREAFNQPLEYPKNNFKLDMKLEVRDPRNSYVWGLASVVGIEGLYLRLRFDKTDKSNDVYELVDSDRIRPIGSTGEPLLPPVNFKGNIANYTKFVEKVLSEPSTCIAPPEFFPPKPIEPQRNLFKVGMKLEALDIKNRDLIYPATVGRVDGTTLRIVFDGWRGSFDYNCDYRSRDLFPINWCRDTAHYIQPPNRWESLIKSGGSTKLPTFSANKSPQYATAQKPHQFTPQRPTQQPALKKVINSSSSKPSVEHHPMITPQQNKVSYHRGRPPKYGTKAFLSRLNSSSGTKDSPKIVTSSNNSTGNQATSTTKLTSSESSSSGTESLIADEEASCSPQPFGTDKYQCQRAVPYDEWKQRKVESQPPREDISESYMIENGDDNDNDDDHNEDIVQLATNPSFNNSTTSNLHLTSSNLATSSGHYVNPSQSKKFKSEIENGTLVDRVGELIHKKSDKISDWTVQDIVELISTDEALKKFAAVFIENEIDGKAFILMTKEILLKHMGFKIGPYLKIADLIERVTKLQ